MGSISKGSLAQELEGKYMFSIGEFCGIPKFTYPSNYFSLISRSIPSWGCYPAGSKIAQPNHWARFILNGRIIVTSSN